MRAVVVPKDMDHKDLVVSENAPEPELGENDVLVDVYAAGLNFFDTLQAKGKYQVQYPHPFVLGAEFAGIISARSQIPTGCTLKHGDRVFGSAMGSYAERVAVDWRTLHQVPAGVSFLQASGLCITWPTSYEGIVGRGALQPGEWVLVHAGAGGVGLPAVQIAKALGARVIATAGSPAKLEVCKKLGGADYAVDYRDPAWPKEVQRITDGKGVDVIFDPVGLIRESLKCIAWKGRLVVIGFAGGPIPQVPANLVLLKNISIVGLYWGLHAHSEPERVPVVWDAIFELLRTQRVRPIVYDEIFEGLASVPAGIEAVVQRKTWGKAVVRVRAEERAKL